MEKSKVQATAQILGRSVVDVLCSKYAGALYATSPRSHVPPASSCLSAAHPATRAVPPPSQTESTPRTRVSRLAPDTAECSALSKNYPVRTCIAPATVPLVVCLGRAIWRTMTVLPCVVRGLREEGITSRRRIRVGRGREGYVQRLLGLLCLLRLRWLRRGRIGRVRVGGRWLVVWIKDKMAIRWARERRCRLLAGVHGAARQFGSSRTGAGKCPRMQRDEECRLKL